MRTFLLDIAMGALICSLVAGFALYCLADIASGGRLSKRDLRDEWL